MRRRKSVSAVAVPRMNWKRTCWVATDAAIGAPRIIVPRLFRDRFAYASDVHAADPGHPAFHLPLPRVAATHGTLAICGDVGLPTEPRFDQFFRQIAPDFDRIIFVPGNHEYGCSSVRDARKVDRYRPAMMDVLARFPNVVVLDNAPVRVAADSGIATWFVGTTLWSNVRLAHHHLRAAAAVRESNAKHAEDVHWLHAALVDIEAQPPAKRGTVVVLSHFPPTERLIEPKYRALPAHHTGWFWTNLEAEFMGEGSIIDGWIAGHSHTRDMRRTVNSVDCRIHSSH